LQISINKFNKSRNTKDLRLLIQKLCEWKALTAQELVDVLQRKDKKHFVRNHLTPMVRDGTLKYLFPEDEDSPNQAYTCEKKRE
ncbi:MAG: hypothetical protein NTX49_00495, partial [Chlamydiae bacterium]|nr:hypothetical protein [Chlamydiota bacterium]